MDYRTDGADVEQSWDPDFGLHNGHNGHTAQPQQAEQPAEQRPRRRAWEVMEDIAVADGAGQVSRYDVLCQFPSAEQRLRWEHPGGLRRLRFYARLALLCLEELCGPNDQRAVRIREDAEGLRIRVLAG
jgi:hypothetical protein